MDVLEKVLGIFFSFLILINGIYFRNRVGTWLSPPCLYSLFWFGYTFSPLFFLLHEPSSLYSIVYIFFSVVIYSSSTIFFTWKSVKNTIVNPIQYDTVFLKSVFFISVFIGIAGNIYQVLNQGINIRDILFDLIEVGSQMAQKRYSENIDVSLLGRLGITFSYVAIVLGGVIFGQTKRRYVKRLALLAFVPFLIILLTQSQKGLVLFATFLFLGGIMINALNHGKIQLFSRKFMKTAFFLFISAVVLMAISFLSRGLSGITEVDIILDSLQSKFISYSFGHFYAFDRWLQAYLGVSKYEEIHFDISDGHLGQYTFMSLWRILLGYEHAILGVYDEYVVFNTDSLSNIFTWYRGLIMDFGLFFSLVFVFFLGLLSNIVYSFFLEGKYNAFSSAFLIFLLGFMYMSWIISLLIWNNVPVLFLITVFLLYVNNNLRIKL